jgi:MoxR-like ATPase
MTGAPGLAKTTLVRVLANHLGAEFGRVQFTPDLLPADITGSEVLNIDPATKERSFDFIKGPVFVNLLLADEINRASPRTQSALLESMQEKTCTVGGQRHILPSPFMVFATQNPFESEGTFPLPEAQMDRFLIHSLVEYPDDASEMKILQTHEQSQLVGEKLNIDSSDSKLGNDNLLAIIEQTKRIPIEPGLLEIIQKLVSYTRPNSPDCPLAIKDALWYGAGPRAGIGLISTSRALAMIEGEERVRWRHIERLARPVLRHRIKLTPQAVHDGFDEDRIITDVMEHLKKTSSHEVLGI